MEFLLLFLEVGKVVLVLAAAIAALAVMVWSVREVFKDDRPLLGVALTLFYATLIFTTLLYVMGERAERAPQRDAYEGPPAEAAR